MPTNALNEYGQRVGDIDLVGLFDASEGSISQYYGKVGNGKTANGTYDIIKDLMNGEVVYANWRLDWQGFDQRQSLFYVFRSLLFPWVKRFYKFPLENLHYIEIDEGFIDRFENLTDCIVYLDEGHVAFDSYEMAKMSLRKRKAVLHTRHFNRTLKILSQRPTAVHVTLRANVNIFYKCQKVFRVPFLGGIFFRKTEFQEMVGETVDETKPEAQYLRYIPLNILDMYDSKYMRKGMLPSQKMVVEAYDLTFGQRLQAFASLCLSLIPFKGSKKGAERRKIFVKSEDVGGSRSITSIKKPERAQYGSGSVVVPQMELPF